MRTTITPLLASKLLEGNTLNRTPRKRHVDWLAGQMRDGKFVYNGEPIIIAEDGRLLDGQQRLMAVMQSGCTVEMEVIKDIPASTFSTIDTGASRNAGDVLAINGVKSCRTVAAIIKAHMNLKTGRAHDVSEGARGKELGLNNEDIVKIYFEYQDQYEKATLIARSLYESTVRLLSTGLTGGIIALLTITFNYSPSMVEDFFRQLYTGNSEFSSIRSLHNKLVNARISHMKLTALFVNNCIAYAWDMYKKGRTKSPMKYDKEFKFE